MDDCDSQIYGGYKQTGDGDKQIPDPKSPELEITTDTVPAQSLDRDKQIDCGNEMAVGAGESQMLSIWSRKRKRSRMSSTKSRKRKRYEPALPEVYSFFTCPQSPAKTEEPLSPEGHGICTCPQNPAKMEEPPLPEGYGYLPVAPGLDENGRYSPGFTNIIRYMSCSRCGINGDHWPHFCTNPVNDPPDAASDPVSWKKLLGNFDANKYLEEQRLKAEEKPKPTTFQTVCTGNKGLFRPNPWRLIFR